MQVEVLSRRIGSVNRVFFCYRGLLVWHSICIVLLFIRRTYTLPTNNPTPSRVTRQLGIRSSVVKYHLVRSLTMNRQGTGWPIFGYASGCDRGLRNRWLRRTVEDRPLAHSLPFSGLRKSPGRFVPNARYLRRA